MRSRAALVLVVVLGAAACGGGSKALTKAQWISQAEAICDRHSSELTTRLQTVTGSTRADLVKAIDIVLDIGQAQEDELQALTPPREDQATVDAIFASYDKTVDAAKDFRAAAAQGDQTEVIGTDVPADLQPKSDAVDAAGNATDALFDAYGATKCGSEASIG
jgi:hypothetical protein